MCETVGSGSVVTWLSGYEISTHPLGSFGSEWRSLRECDEEWTKGFEVMYWMGLGRVVGKVVRAGFPYHMEVALLDSILDPMILHINGLASFDFGRAVGEVASRLVVINDYGGTLRVT